VSIGNFRVTERSVSMTALAGVQADLAALGRTQEQLSTGRAINRPSDDPVGTVTALQDRAALARQQQYDRNTQDGLSWLGTADTALSDTVSQLQRVRSLVLQAANASSNPTSQAAAAQEVTQIRQQLISVANAAYAGQPVFAGTAGTTQAYDSAGNYLGDSAVVQRQVADGSRVAVALPGTQVFGPAGADVFTVLQQTLTDLTSNPIGLSADLTALDGAMARIQTSQAQVGSLYNRVDAAKTAATNTTAALTEQLGQVEDADLARTVTTLQMQQVAYQAALSATARAIQPSLLDFLK
jgi:flagellar hook-associated protein 3 FlgL